MDRDRLAQALMGTFLEELEGHVAALNRDLLAWEKTGSTGRSRELMASLLRTVHSVKGASRAVSLTLVETVCHRLEEVLSTVQHGRPATPELYELGAPIDEREDRPEGVHIRARLPRRDVPRFAPYLVDEAREEPHTATR